MKTIYDIYIYCFLLIMIGIFYSSSLRTNTLTDWECASDNYSEQENEYRLRELEKAVLRAKIWKIHTSDGLFEMSENAVENGLQNMIASFKEIGILVSIYDT